MLAASAEQILDRLGPSDLVLDVGGWASAVRAGGLGAGPDAVRDPGLYGEDPCDEERFGADTWVQRDICDREPWPFADGQFDFVICSHTLEDIRDPVWVCSELQRVGAAGYIEVPSRLEEQSYGIQGPWVGWGHHHWLIDAHEDGLRFVFKHHVIHGRPQAQLPESFWHGLSESERVLSLWWEGSFACEELALLDAEGLDAYLDDFVTANGGPYAQPPAAPWRRALRRVADSRRLPGR